MGGKLGGQEESLSGIAVPEEHRATFDELQRLDQGKMQALGDELLPGIFPALVGLKPHGLNAEGKTIKGVPDSFVGETPAKARAAVEYTTQASRLDQKLLSDFRSIRKNSPDARTLFLCTNRSIEGLDLTQVWNEAAQASVSLEIINGRKLAEWLCTQRQDLRRRYLGIAIGSHTGTSLVQFMRDHLLTMTQGQTTPGTLDRFIPRNGLDLSIVHRINKGPGFTLLTASAGMGKTTWSVEHTRRYSFVEPIVWMVPGDLSVETADPISDRVIMAAYGTPDPGRLVELAELLRREGRFLRIFIDGVDEARDYGRLEHQLRTFRGSAIARYAHVVLLCRGAAARLLVDTLAACLPELRLDETTIAMAELNQGEAEKLLRKLGAEPQEVREIESHLPSRYAGNPLFVVHALQLYRNGELASAGEDLIPAIANHFEKDIQRRLKKDGQAPRVQKIRTLLGRLAIQVLKQGSDAMGVDEIAASFPEELQEGENTIFARAEQTGLLIQKGQGRVGFSHPLFLEYFAAQAIDGNDLILQQELLKGGGSGREVILRLIGSVPDPAPILRFMLERDPIGACEAATRLKRSGPHATLFEDPTHRPKQRRRSAIDKLLKMLGFPFGFRRKRKTEEDLASSLLGVVKGLLNSRFPSDQERAIQILGRLPVPGVRELAAEWFKGLSAQARRQWAFAAAELFLSLNEAGAVGVIMHHRGFQYPPDMPWYEPTFVRRVRGLSDQLRSALGQQARQALQSEQNTSRRVQFIHILGTLGDSWLVEHLRERLSCGWLAAYEHRALILLNTYESILLYAESAERYLQMRDEGASEAEGTPESEEQEENSWYQVVVKQSDIVMYPHDQLTALVLGALGSENWRNAIFGFDWADTLQDPDLLEAYSAAMHRFSGSFFALRGWLIEKTLEVMPFEHIRQIYEDTQSQQLRKDIVRYMRAPGAEAEAFLIERLEEPVHQFSAIQSLGLIGSVSAGAAIQRFLFHESADLRRMAVTTIGRLRYRPALVALTHLLDETLEEQRPNGSQRPSNLEYVLIESIGSIGGPVAYASLERAFQAPWLREHVLQVLAIAAEPSALRLAAELVAAHPELKTMLSQAISRAVLRSHGGVVGVVGQAPSDLHFTDEQALGFVLEVARAALSSGEIASLYNPLTAVSAFDLPQARAFLQELAGQEPSTNLHDTQGPQAFIDPVRHARKLLGELGDPNYQQEAVEHEISTMMKQMHLSGLDIQRLRAFPTALVSAALRRRINARHELVKALFLFRWFAEPEDRALLEVLEGDPNPDVADLAHAYLVDPRRFMI